MKKIVLMMLVMVVFGNVMANWTEPLNVGTVQVVTLNDESFIKFSTETYDRNNNHNVVWYKYLDTRTSIDLTENEKSILSILLTAQNSGSKVIIHLDTSTASSNNTDNFAGTFYRVMIVN